MQVIDAARSAQAAISASEESRDRSRSFSNGSPPRFAAWSAGDDVLATFPIDVLLTNLMFYWVPNSAPSAARSYFEAWRDPDGMMFPTVEVPTAVASFPAEPWRVPRRWAEPRFDIRRWTDMPRGGHFGALEEPELLTDDIRCIFRTLRV